MTAFDIKYVEMDAKTVVEDYSSMAQADRPGLESALKLAASAYRGITAEQTQELENLIAKAINLTKEKIPEISGSEWSKDHVQNFLNVYLEKLKEVVEDHNYRQEPKLKLG